MPNFRWNKKTETAAFALAEGKSKRDTAREVGIDESTLYRWLRDPEFSAEVDRLTLMIGVASRAERLRIAKRVITQKTKDETIITEKDLLDWLKFAQSETDGIKLDLAKIATAFGEDASSLADS